MKSTRRLMAGATLLGGTLAIRLGTAGLIMRRIGDSTGPRCLAWLPLRDLAGMGSWLVAIFKRTFVWRDLRFGLTRDGRVVPRQT